MMAGCTNGGDETSGGANRGQLQKLLDLGMRKLDVTTIAHRDAWGLGSFKKWKIDPESKELVFFHENGDAAVRTPVQIIGQFDTKTETWQWSWADESLDTAFTSEASEIKRYGAQHGLSKLTESSFPTTELEALSLATLALQLCDAQGVFPLSEDGQYIFVSFGRVELLSSENGP